MTMKQLWAPWRMEFLSEGKKSGGCVFCDLPKGDDDRKSLILFRGESVFVILNKYPYNNGHLMVVPYQHTAKLEDLKGEALSEMMSVAQSSVVALTNAYHPEGFNLGMNLGASAGAGIRDHLHLHVVPRWVGDTNFLPVLGETKAMPQHLESSYDALYRCFHEQK